MTIHEPMTAFTDLVVALWTWCITYRIARVASCWAQRAWAFSIAMVGVSALTGGLFHALSSAHPLAAPLWSVAMIAAGLSSGSLVVGSARGALPRRWARVATVVVAAEVVVYLIRLPGHAPIEYAVAQYGRAMLALVCLESYAWLALGSRAAPWFLAGFLAALVAAGAQKSGLAPHPGFNQNDLAHLIQLVVMGLFFLGAARLRERDEDSSATEARSEPGGVQRDR